MSLLSCKLVVAPLKKVEPNMEPNMEPNQPLEKVGPK